MLASHCRRVSRVIGLPNVATASWPVKVHHSPPPQFGIVVAKDRMVAMRDGVRLATDLYRPARDGEPVPGPFPTILCRTPYDKTDRRYAEIADFFTPRGYVTVLQDLRGRHRSEGVGQYFHVANEHDGTD